MACRARISRRSHLHPSLCAGSLVDLGARSRCAGDQVCDIFSPGELRAHAWLNNETVRRAVWLIAAGTGPALYSGVAWLLVAGDAKIRVWLLSFVVAGGLVLYVGAPRSRPWRPGEVVAVLAVVAGYLAMHTLPW